MLALLSETCGPAEVLVLRKIDEPAPRPGEVRIAVEACGLNYPDVLMIEDKYQFSFERPFAPGIEICGVIDALGADVDNVAVGDRVVAQIDHGGLAGKALARADRVQHVPKGVPPEIAASSLLTFGTSLYALRDRAQLKAGETLLVLGAGGGVGLAAVQLGRLMGARVIAAASSEEKAAAARAVGANDSFIYETGNVDGRALASQIKEVTAGGCDVIYDPVGGPYAEPAIRSMNWGGRYLIVGFAGGIPRPGLNLILLKGCQLVGVFWGAAIARDPALGRATVAELLNMIASGRLHPPVPAVYPLERGSEALVALRDRTAVGKLVVAPCGRARHAPQGAA